MLRGRVCVSARLRVGGPLPALRLVVVWCVAIAASFIALTPAHAEVTYEMVTVGNAGNAPDPATGSLYGAVNYDYQIGKYEVTIGQWCDFLNAAAQSDPYGLWNSNMETDLRIAGIARTGSSGSYSYSVMGPSGTTPLGADSPGNRPITYTSFFDAARFANWMTNGQGSGNTETGAYTISTGQITSASRTSGVNTYTLAAASTLSVGDQVSVSGLGGTAFNVSGVVTSVSGFQFTISNTNADAVATGTGSMTGASATHASNAAFYIPTESEWYKAAYYAPVLNSGSGGYWTYATQSNEAPGNTLGSGTNQANYNNGVYSVTQSASSSTSQNLLANVGAFTTTASYYGTFDQTGNAWEWNEVIAGAVTGSTRQNRGGAWNRNAFSSSSAYYLTSFPTSEGNSLSFRLAAPAAVPEPSTYCMALAGIACGGLSMWRRRKRA